MNTTPTPPSTCTAVHTSAIHMIVSKTTIEREAEEAAQKGQSLAHACPYPFDSEAGRYFTQRYHDAVKAQTQEGGAA
jgi:hypothetical protein